MKFYTSYFYQVRFFKPNMVPISTAKWDPAWFSHNGHYYKDKNGVYNGLKALPLALPDSYWEELKGEEQCSKECPHDKTDCAFMRVYRKYLNTLDIHDIVHRCETLAKKVQAKEGFTEEPIIVLLVHESASCVCAERPVLQSWFHDNGYEIEEWHKE